MCRACIGECMHWRVPFAETRLAAEDVLADEDMQNPQEGLAASGRLHAQTCCKQCRLLQSSHAVHNHLNSCAEAADAGRKPWHQPVLHQHPASAVQRLRDCAACVPLLLQGHCACNCCTQLPVNAPLLSWCMTAGHGAVMSWAEALRSDRQSLRTGHFGTALQPETVDDMATAAAHLELPFPETSQQH